MSRRRKKIITCYLLEVIEPKYLWWHKRKCILNPPCPWQDCIILNNTKQVNKYLRKAFTAGAKEVLVERITSYNNYYYVYKNSKIITMIFRKKERCSIIR